MSESISAITQRLFRRRLILQRQRFILIPALLLILVLAYAATIQTHISGSFGETSPGNIHKNEYIKDVAEIQVALNAWGTIHHTGYPLFAILGNLFATPARILGIEPAFAASLYATLWGLIALFGFGLLIWKLTGQPVLTALTVVLLGLAKSIWIHNVIAEVYSMSLAIIVLLLVVALWPVPWTGQWNVRRRVLWLALIGGIGVAHHRAVAFVAPGLLFAVWPNLWPDRAQWRYTFSQAAGLIALGFIPYVYLPLREWLGGAWVYGEPGTLRGFWIEFRGKEADRLVTLPNGLSGWMNNIESTWNILTHELTLPGLLIALGALILVMVVSPHRRAAWIVALCAAGPTLFTLVYHTAVLPEAILMPTVLALVFGVALFADWLARLWRPCALIAGVSLLAWIMVLFGTHYSDIRELTTNRTGLDTIERLNHVPRNGKPALMLPWGPRYAAAAYTRLVTGQNADIMMVDHKGDLRRLIADDYQIYTEWETFYTLPPPWSSALPVTPSDWWPEHLGPLYLTSAGPGIVQIQLSPWLANAQDGSGTPVIYGIAYRNSWLTCDDEYLYLHIIWQADSRPTNDPSIFVHLTGEEPSPVLEDADTRYPVYGLYPFTRWSPGEIVRDDFTLPRLPGGTQVRFGLYEQIGGQFVNYGEMALPVADCQREDQRE